MKCYFIINLLLNLILICSCGTMKRNFSDPEHPGRCVIKNLDLILSVGSIKNPNTCEQIYCSSDGTVMFIDCGPILPENKNCSIGKFIDETRPFPECCTRKLHCRRSVERQMKVNGYI